MGESIRIIVQDSSRTAEARRLARRMALDIGLGETEAERVSICITEACTNLLKHVVEGEILLRTTSEDPPELEMLALDRGPGMANLERCLQDGYSTGGSPGEGLGAIMRLSAASDFYSTSGQGTVVLARWLVPGHGRSGPGHSGPGQSGPDLSGRLQIGAVNVCKTGQEVCGDSWGVEQTDTDTVILVADGLGHGPEAQAAALEATRMLRLNPDLAPQVLIERTHHALRSSRGAAVAVARIDRVGGRVAFAGLGNIAAQIYSGSKLQQHLVSVNGTAGHQMQRLREFSYPWPPDGMLVLHSDGLATGTSVQGYAGLASRDPTLIAGVLYRDFSRGNDDSTVVVAKAP